MEGYETPPIAGPGAIGHLAAIAIGAYTDITAIYGPAEAAYGDLVSVEVRVRNLSGSPIYISTMGRYDGIDFALNPEYASVEAGLTQSFTYSFYMPNNDVRLDVWTFYWTGTEWYQDDHEYVAIALAVPPEVYAGTISRKEVEYDGSRAGIPAY
ncbi:hypothetical protein ES703_01210 [subsurface metagenome]